MATVIWRPQSSVRSQVDWAVPAPGSVTKDERWTLKVNKKKITVAATDNTVATLCSAFVTAINASTIPEWQELTAATGNDSEGNVDKIVVTGEDTLGRPFTMTSEAADAGALGVEVTEVRKGAAGVNEKQVIALTDSKTPPSGGTFTLSWNGGTTATIAHNASAATVQTAIEGLSTVVSGDVAVTGASGGPWTVEFQQNFAKTPVPLMFGDGSSLTVAQGGTIKIISVSDDVGIGPTGWRRGETWKLSTSTAEPGSFTITFRGKTTDPIREDPDIDDVREAMEALDTVGFGNVYVSETDLGTGAVGKEFLITFKERGGFTRGGSAIDVPAPTVSNSNWSFALESDKDAADYPDKFEIIFTGEAAGGTFTLTYAGQTTSNISFPLAATTDVQNELDGLSTVTSSVVDWKNDESGDDITRHLTVSITPAATAGGELTANGANLTGPSNLPIWRTQTGAADVNEVMEVALTGNPTGGTWTLTHDGNETSNFTHDESAADIQSALEALASISASGDVEVEGEDGGPWLIRFKGLLAGSDESLTADGSNLTGTGADTFTVTTKVTATGPHNWDDDDNWDTGTKPANTDDVVFENSDVDCLFGLDQSSITLTSLSFKQNYEGKIGLPVHNGDYFEYLQAALKIGATTVNVGDGEGLGSPRIRLDNAAIQATVNVYNTGVSDEEGVPAFIWKGTHASNVMRISRGDVGAAFFGGESATLATLTVGFTEDEEGDTTIICGSGVTFTDIDQSGGLLDISSGTTTLEIFGGTCIIRGGTQADIDVLGGRMEYRSSGTITALAVANAIADFSKDMRSRTITQTVQLYAGAVFLDPFKTVTFSGSPDMTINQAKLSDVEIDLGVGRGLDVT